MKRILLVDDNLATLKHVSALLAGSCEVVLAKSGGQALSIAAKTVPDLVLLDVEMPEMDGFEIMAALRRIPSCARIPVIFLTANQDTATQVRALTAGDVDFIKKPFEKGVLLHRIELHLRLSQYQQGLERTVKDLEDSIISAFAELIGCRDGHSGGHVRRTREYVALLGSLLLRENVFPGELDEAALDMVVRAAPLHDIGKIGISDIILLKPDKLNEEEFDIVKRHSIIGARALEKVYERTPTQHYLTYAIMMAESHHEWFDGRGYPFGLAGEDIPLCSRILAPANVYDALTTSTVMRTTPMGHEEACRIIAEGAGGEFDPRITAVFLANADRFGALKDGLGDSSYGISFQMPETAGMT